VSKPVSLTGTWTAEGKSPVLKIGLSATGVPVSGLTDLLPAADIVLPSKTTPEGALLPRSLRFTTDGISADPQFRSDVGAIATGEINRGLNGLKVGSVGVGQTAGKTLQGLFGGKK